MRELAAVLIVVFCTPPGWIGLLLLALVAHCAN
jgi:hypothetical protein